MAPRLTPQAREAAQRAACERCGAGCTSPLPDCDGAVDLRPAALMRALWKLITHQP
jgi:hypothetical protein